MTRTGRPPKAGVARKRQFAVRVTPEEEREILELAEKTGMTVSDVFRMAMLAVKAYSRSPEALAIAFYPDEEAEMHRIVVPALAEGGQSKTRRRAGAASA
jgi:hypothetical protein